MNIFQAATGRYEANGNLVDADCVVGHSFGTLTGDGSVNKALADMITASASGRPVIVDRMLVEAFLGREQQVTYVAEGPISNSTGSRGGTWQTLFHARAYMQREGLSTALQVAQAYHVGRVVMQARKLGIDSVVLEGLPESFDHDSEQWWTRSAGLWMPRELLGSLVLHAKKKL